MNISDNIIKKSLEHVYFINGTAYAGKSTVCKMLAKKHNMLHCEENYKLGDFIEFTNKDTHPNLHYFNTMSGWEEFVTRDKEEYVAWLDGVSKETTELEILTLLSLPRDRKIIVDTNIPHDVLQRISDKSRVAYMVTTPEISRDEFFNRLDKEKNFLLNVIKETDAPERNLMNFKEMIRHANRQEVIDRFANSGFFCIKRNTVNEDVEDKYTLIENHFDLK